MSQGILKPEYEAFFAGTRKIRIGSQSDLAGALRWLKLSKTSHRVVLDSLTHVMGWDCERMFYDKSAVDRLRKGRKEVVFLVSEPGLDRTESKESVSYGINLTYFFARSGLFLARTHAMGLIGSPYFNPSSPSNTNDSSSKMTIEVRVRDYKPIPNPDPL